MFFVSCCDNIVIIHSVLLVGDIICGEEKCEDVSVRPVSENTVQILFSDIQDLGSRSRSGQGSSLV